MTEKEALDILGLEASTGREQRMERYEAAFSKAQSELIQAYSPELKQKFQSRLDQLRMVQATLFAAPVASLNQLPSTEPVREQRATGGGASGFSMPDAPALPLPKSGANKWLVVALIVSLAALTFFAMKYFEMKPKAEWHDRMNKIFQNGQFEIINRGEKPYMLYGFEAFYIEADTIAKRTCDAVNTVLEPNRPFKPEPIVKGNRETYSGEVLFYSMVLGDAEGNQEPINVSGVWPAPDEKGRSSKLQINYDDKIFPKIKKE